MLRAKILIAKKCIHCGRILGIDDYSYCKTKGRYLNICKKCIRLKDNLRYKYEGGAEKSHQKYMDKIETKRQYASEWRKRNKDKVAKQTKRYRKKYPEKTKARNRLKQIKRDYQIKGVAIPASQVIDRYGDTCYLCGAKVLQGNIHLDHVKPLSRGGKHEIENLRVTHSWCNESKGNKLLKEIEIAV